MRSLGAAMSEIVHRWERENRQGQCTCAQCLLPDPRGLDCADCPARLNPGDPDFETLYEVAPWWFDSDGDAENEVVDHVDIDAMLQIPVISVRRGGIQFPGVSS